MRKVARLRPKQNPSGGSSPDCNLFPRRCHYSVKAMSIEGDREIVARVLAGDKAAFGALIERHRASALAFSRRILDPNEAEDAVQEAFCAAGGKVICTMSTVGRW